MPVEAIACRRVVAGIAHRRALAAYTANPTTEHRLTLMGTTASLSALTEEVTA